MKVATSLQTESFHPIVATLKKKISGSIEGEAIQKDITGAKGTPPISRLAIRGITPQEQNGLNAPTNVANSIDRNTFLFNAFEMYFDTPDTLTITDIGIVIIT